MQPYQLNSTDWIKQELAGLLGEQVTRDINDIIRLYSLYDGDGQYWQVDTNGLDYTPTVKVTNIIAELIGKEARYMMGVEPELRTLEQVGRAGVKAAAVPLSAVPLPERKVRPVTFTVQSARLDAVVSGIFRLSRTSAAAQIRAGAVHLNYAECLRPDAPVAPGDVLSLRGAGKGSVTEVGGMSRKGRQFVTAELWQ